MRLEQAAERVFANHQTFHPRFGWIKKAFSAAVADPDVFNAEDATVRLGVGKNMVEAIRFWTVACRVLATEPKPDRPRMSVVRPTPLGRAIFDEEHGWDPYTEDVATLWILHWHLISPKSQVPVWWVVFNDLGALEFTEPDLVQFVSDEVAATSWAQPMPSSIQKDVDCLLRMYSLRHARGRQNLDELIDSPFRELGLIAPAPGSTDALRFVRGQKPGLPPAVVVYACLDYLARFEPDARTATVSRLTADAGSPGRLFKLTEDVVLGAIEAVAVDCPEISVATPAGAPQLMVKGNPEAVATDVLLRYYRGRGRAESQRVGYRVAGWHARSIELAPLPLFQNVGETPHPRRPAGAEGKKQAGGGRGRKAGRRAEKSAAR